MKLVQNWRRVMLRAWSVRFAMAAIVIEVANALPGAGDIIPNWLSVLFLFLVPVARVVQQESVGVPEPEPVAEEPALLLDQSLAIPDPDAPKPARKRAPAKKAAAKKRPARKRAR